MRAILLGLDQRLALLVLEPSFRLPQSVQSLKQRPYLPYAEVFADCYKQCLALCEARPCAGPRAAASFADATFGQRQTLILGTRSFKASTYTSCKQSEASLHAFTICLPKSQFVLCRSWLEAMELSTARCWCTISIATRSGIHDDRVMLSACTIQRITKRASCADRMVLT